MMLLLAILTALPAPACPKLARHIHREAAEHHVRPALLDAVAKVETRCNSRAVGKHGERSAWQILPTGSAARGEKRGLWRPAKGAHLAAAHLERLLKLCDGNEVAALGLYQGARKKCDGRPTRYAGKVLAVAGTPKVLDRTEEPEQ
jgi:soluble lytic murein transglycosylase-like protein